jgi:glycosyltransferase involved in cell wall biosynthesis
MPLISIIVPVYNGEKTIEETIATALRQTFKDFELIVVNDGSKDTTLEIVSNIQDPRLRIFSYENKGQAASRNRGLAHATGEFIAFLDADDLWTPDKLGFQLMALEENPQAAVAYSWTDLIDESGKFLRRGAHVTVNGDVFARLLLSNFLDNGSNALIRKQALTEVGGFDESLPPAEDWDMWLRLAAHYQFVAVPFPQVLYRVSTNSASSNVLRMESASLKVIERALAQAPEALQRLKPRILANTYKYLTYKALEGYPERQKSLIASRFLWHAIKNDPALLRARVLWKVWLVIAITGLLPAKKAHAVLANFKFLANINALFGYLQTETL